MAACGQSNYGSLTNEVPVEVDVIVAHFGSDANIRVGTSLAQTGETQYWGFRDVRVSVAVPLASPPSAPSPPGQWSLHGHNIFPRDNRYWRNSDGSSIRDDQVTTCGSVGTMLGGYQVFGNGAFVQTFVADLPPHTALRVQFTFIRVDLCTHAWASMPPKHPPNHAPRIAFTEVRTSRA